MTRKEKIRNAATQYATHLVDTDVTDFHGKYETKMDFVLSEHNAFLAGAKLADKHPKSPWVSVNDDLPCNHEEFVVGTPFGKVTEEVLVLTKRGYYIAYMHFNNVWSWSINKDISHWMPIPKLEEE